MNILPRLGLIAKFSWASKEHRLAMLIVLAHFALGVVYSVTIPLWEAYDEWGHYAPMEFIATRHALPRPGESVIVLGRDPRQREVSFFDESHQPPLYHLLGALAISWIDTSDDPTLLINPLLSLGGTSREYAVLHGAEEAFPYRDTVLAVHTVRLLSAVLSTFAIVLTYMIGRILFAPHRDLAVGAMAVNALWPQFLFMGSVVSNDIAVALFSSLFLYWLIRLLMGVPNRRALLMLNLAFTLALLSKLNAVALIPFYGVGIAAYARQQGHQPNALKHALVWSLGGLGLATALAGGWLARQLSADYTFVAPRLGFSLALQWENLPGLLGVLRWSPWAQLGWGKVWAEPWTYALYSVLCLMGGVGIVLFLLRHRDRRATATLVLLAFCVGFALVALYVGLASGVSPLGRWVLPGIPALSLLLVQGWREVFPGRFRSLLLWATCLALLLVAISVPFRVITPYYSPPPKVTLDQVQASAQPLSFSLGREIDLLGYQLDRPTLRPGELSTITLYLRLLAPLEKGHIMGIHLLAPDLKSYGMDNFFPGKGSYLNAQWRPGEIVKETARIRLLPDFPTPAYAQIQVLLIDPEEGILPVSDGEGTPLSNNAAIFGRIRIIPEVWPRYEIKSPRSYKVGEGISFEGFTLIGESRPSSTLELLLYWKSLERVSADYQVFVHLVDASGEIRAQADGPPREGFYPTSVWIPGDLVEDLHQLKLPENLEAGDYEIRIGMYVLDSGERLLIMDSQGQMSDFIRLGNISIQ